ncbi:MAG: dihydropteroate synthase [Nitrospinota bacterium]
MSREWSFAGKSLSFKKPLIMGIINATPDSFSDGGQYLDSKAAYQQAVKLLNQGADIIDIGGESTRPFAKSISPLQEQQRVIPLIEMIMDQLPDTIISIDTRKPEVAKLAIEAGASIINDVSGLADPVMRHLAEAYNLPVIIMHMKGTPESMQTNVHYDDLINEIADFFESRIKLAKQDGVEKIILDPGIGFGKTVEHNLILLANLHRFKKFNSPLLIGASRKSFISITTGVDSRESEKLDRVTAALTGFVLADGGVDIVRVHDVQSSYHVATMVDAIMANREC